MAGKLAQTHARASAHSQGGPDGSKRSLPSVTGPCLSEHNVHAAAWQQALPASCSRCVMRQSEEINFAVMVQSRTETTTRTSTKCTGVSMNYSDKRVPHGRHRKREQYNVINAQYLYGVPNFACGFRFL